MIIEEFRQINSSKKELQKFSRVLGIAFIILGLLLWYSDGRLHPSPFIISFVLLIVGLLFPFLLLPLHKFWMGLSIILGFISTRVILTIIYYFVLTPIAVISRMFGVDFLDEKIDKQKHSYWLKKAQYENNSENIKRQF